MKAKIRLKSIKKFLHHPKNRFCSTLQLKESCLPLLDQLLIFDTLRKTYRSYKSNIAFFNLNKEMIAAQCKITGVFFF